MRGWPSTHSTTDLSTPPLPTTSWARAGGREGPHEVDEGGARKAARKSRGVSPETLKLGVGLDRARSLARESVGRIRSHDTTTSGSGTSKSAGCTGVRPNSSSGMPNSNQTFGRLGFGAVFPTPVFDTRQRGSNTTTPTPPTEPRPPRAQRNRAVASTTSPTTCIMDHQRHRATAKPGRRRWAKRPYHAPCVDSANGAAPHGGSIGRAKVEVRVGTDVLPSSATAKINRRRAS